MQLLRTICNKNTKISNFYFFLLSKNIEILFIWLIFVGHPLLLELLFYFEYCISHKFLVFIVIIVMIVVLIKLLYF